MTRGYDQKEHEQAFGRGVEAGKNGGFWEDLAHEFGRVIGTVVPGETTEHQSEERGYEEGRRQRTGW